MLYKAMTLLRQTLILYAIGVNIRKTLPEKINAELSEFNVISSCSIVFYEIWNVFHSSYPIENLAFSLCSEIVKKFIFFEKVVFCKTFPFNMGLNSLLNLTCVAHHY